ncbi:MAG: hypothetical protein WDO56_34850 [Gammaproteobacteria bacterium]
MWKVIRITVLLLVLVGVGGTAYFDRLNTTSWAKTLWVGIFPLNGDGSAVTDDYIHGLTPHDFESLETFFAQEAARYGVQVDRPVRIQLYPSPRELPPRLAPDSGALAATWWSLKMRWYARKAADVPGFRARTSVCSSFITTRR